MDEWGVFVFVGLAVIALFFAVWIAVALLARSLAYLVEPTHVVGIQVTRVERKEVTQSKHGDDYENSQHVTTPSPVGERRPRFTALPSARGAIL